ncbi:hypothetical protein [Halorubrum ezzemoulense]|uniref:hypothetical protein n=1 Tax=Halorubrum ezzemoulense TaxID=337243 RepID=UPI00117AE0BD|nr:hypothetical protein [Halorubrum ezzemoulense]
MNRRKFIAALGAATVGTSAAAGTGAFTSVSAGRSVNIEVADDSDAFVALTASNGPNGSYASTDDGELIVQLNESNDTLAGDGVNDDAVTRIHDVFRIRNQGTQQVFVFFEEFGGDAVTLLGGTTTAKNNGNRIYDSPPSGLVPSETPPMEGSSNALRTPVGAPIPVTIEIDTTGSNSLENLAENFTVRAESEPPEDSPFDDSRFDPNPD